MNRLNPLISSKESYRYRVRNNLPGTPVFCPLVFCTEVLERFIAMDLQAGMQEAVAAVPRDLLARRRVPAAQGLEV